MARTAAVFDMDGVLVDNSRFHRTAWRQLWAEEGLALPDGEWWRLTIGRPVEEAVPLLLGRPLPAGEAARLAARKTALYHALADGQAAGVTGVVPFVRSLVAARVPLALATSAVPESAAAIVAALGLAGAFPVRVTAGDITRGKPDPAVYLTAAARLGVEPAACVAFEDAVVGVEAARRAGMAVVGVTTAYPGPELRAAGAAHVVTDFAGLDWRALAAL
jgi:HAD superfamily hydrolase (TIGR01509 family)